MTRWTATASCATARLTERAVADLDRSVTYDAEAQVLSAVFEVKAPTLRQATTLALRLARPLLREKPSAIAVQPTEQHQALLAHPPEMDLLSVGDAAQVLGVSATRVIQLLQKTPGFPAPVAKPRSGPIWTRASIEAFRTRRENHPLAAGRPRKHA